MADPSDKVEPHTVRPLVSLSSRERGGIAALLVLLAVVHAIFPDLAIDAVFLGLLAFAAIVYWFDIDRIEWQGVRARRREIEQASIAIEATSITGALVAPPPPPNIELSTGGRPISTEGELTGSVERSAYSVGLEALEPPIGALERLLWGYEQIRTELALIAGNAGWLPERKDWGAYSTFELANAIRRQNVLPDELSSAIRTVTRARNDAVHWHGGPPVIEPASNLALEVLAKIRQIRREYIRVRHQDLSLFADEKLTDELSVRGVMLVQLDQNANILLTHVFPRELSYEQGRFVSWEWNLDRWVRQQTWYRDPESGQPRSAFSSSAVFIGREYPERWLVKYRLPDPEAGLP